MKRDKYLFIALTINFLVALSYIFEKVVKILTGRNSMYHFLEVPLSSGEIVIYFNGWHNTLTAIFTIFGWIISKPTAFRQEHSKVWIFLLHLYHKHCYKM